MSETTPPNRYLYQAVGGKFVCLDFDKAPTQTYPKLSGFRLYVGWPPHLSEVVIDHFYLDEDGMLGITLPSYGYGKFWPFAGGKPSTWDNTPLTELPYTLYEVVRTENGVTVR